MPAKAATLVPDTVTPWEEFLGGNGVVVPWAAQYKQSQHVTVIGPTGGGKTTLVREIIKPRGHIVATGVKYRDDTMAELLREGWTRISKWEDRPRAIEKQKRLLLWPKVDDMDKLPQVHGEVFRTMINAVYKEGHRCVWFDELRYLASPELKLRGLIERFYVLARSNYISIVGSAQRPAHVPLEAYSQASHLFLFQTGDERDLERLGGMNGVSAKLVASVVATLPDFHFLHVNLRTRQMAVSTVTQ